MSRPNFDNDTYFLNLVNSGRLHVSANGIVYNPATNREIGYTSTRGYKAIGIKENKKVRHMLVHRLVVLVYGNGFTEDKPIVNHIKNKRDFNDISNLEPVSYKENSAHASSIGSLDYPRGRGENASRALLTNEQVREIREKNKTLSYNKLAKEYNISKGSIAKIIQNKSYIGV